MVANYYGGNLDKAKNIAVNIGNKATEIGKDTLHEFQNVIKGPTFFDILKKLLKYIIEGLVVAIAGYYIPAKKPEISELIIIALVAASTFAILEVYMPDAYMASRLGFGFQTGRNLIPPIV